MDIESIKNTVIQGDCLEILTTIPDNSIDAIVTDPPYELGFMGKSWDSTGIAYNKDMRNECLRVLKPGGHLLAFSGTRTYHRMAVAIEDAGFEVRDMIEWVYGSGFPKSLAIGKAINKIETDEWSKIGKALDIVNKKDILQIWKKNSNNVSIVETQSLRNQIIAGQDMPREISVQANVAEENNQENGNLIVDFVVKNLQEVQVLLPEINTVLMNVDVEIKQKQDLAKFVEQLLQSQSHKFLNTSTVEGSVNELQREKTNEITKVEEVLMTLRGNKKYGNNEVINALCVALTENLKHIILNQSKTFQNLDTIQQMECVSAINVTITESTAECLISSTVDIAKKIAVDKLQGNEREVVGDNPNHRGDSQYNNEYTKGLGQDGNITKGTSEWEGWGTALKPAHEPICMARKPLAEKTVAENVLKYGTGGINIDESRVEADIKNDPNYRPNAKNHKGHGSSFSIQGDGQRSKEDLPDEGFHNSLGRFPANLILEDCEEVRECFPDVHGAGNKNKSNITAGKSMFGIGDKGARNPKIEGDNGGNASRFFKSIIYQAKASKSERNKGCEEFEDKERVDYGGFHSEKGLIENNRNPENRLPTKNNHPTVKPIALMEYLIKMVTPKGGIVLDPFTGSGSTLVAAKQNGFQYIGIEMTEEYITIIEARLNAVVKEEPEQDLQPSLF